SSGRDTGVPAVAAAAAVHDEVQNTGNTGVGSSNLIEGTTPSLVSASVVANREKAPSLENTEEAERVFESLAFADEELVRPMREKTPDGLREEQRQRLESTVFGIDELASYIKNRADTFPVGSWNCRQCSELLLELKILADKCRVWANLMRAKKPDNNTCLNELDNMCREKESEILKIQAEHNSLITEIEYEKVGSLPVTFLSVLFLFSMVKVILESDTKDEAYV
ncbi:unnamed protein product, partial [Gongylonema pulchrum]|uniref:TTKRSYEDQ domain-containing protein n=1 Tax=Gongylonema pulchrum TaxID=637853 RepID=A0A183DHU2_9BILA